jgi:conjugative transfer region protein (TIGR03748 family)
MTTMKIPMTMTALTAFMTLLMFSASIQAAQQANKLIDRYTVLNPIQTPAQADPLSVVISIKFAKSVLSVKQAIEQLLRQSGYTLSKNYELEKINTFTLPKVHQQLGPMSLKRMIKVLLGPAWDLSVDQITRNIQIVQTGSHTLQVLTPDAKALLKGVITPSVLDEVVVVSINNNLLLLALEKILPKGWRVVLSDDSQDLAIKTVSVVSEDSKREIVIKKILTDVGAQGFFYKKLKLLVVRSHQTIIK